MELIKSRFKFGDDVKLMPKDKNISDYELWTYRTVNVPERFGEWALIKADDEATKNSLIAYKFLKVDINYIIDKYDGITFPLISKKGEEV